MPTRVGTLSHTSLARYENRTGLPNALLLATVIVTILYVSLNAVFLASAPMDAFAGKIEVERSPRETCSVNKADVSWLH